MKGELKDVEYCRVCKEPIGYGFYGIMKWKELKMKVSRAKDYCWEHDPKNTNNKVKE